MSPVPAELLQLPIPDRISLVEALWESIVEDQEQLELSDAQKSELSRRLTAREGRDAASSWSDVKKRILEK